MKKKQQQKSRIAEKYFRKDPNKFAHNLFHPPKQNGQPKFTAETATNYFQQTYTDTDRSYTYVPLPEMIRPELPTSTFATQCPSLAELQKSAKNKRNGAAPGLNGITYIPYKKCIALLKFVVRLGRKIWKKKEIPLDWARAYIILLAKSQDLENISEFRPIAITSTAGKIFFSVISDRLQFFMIQNSYISRDIQKGFLFGVPGCLEHSFTHMEALKEAKELNHQIVISWIDLANAYGSIRHNLIQFALNWYHVPIPIQQLIFDYYEKLCAMIKTREWTTGFFLFDIGLFQGCVLSTILIDCVFQLLLDFLRPIKNLAIVLSQFPRFPYQ